MNLRGTEKLGVQTKKSIVKYSISYYSLWLLYYENYTITCR
jgi:hypothetical protein